MKKTAGVCCALLLALQSFAVGVSAEGYGQGKERDAANRPTGACMFQEQYADLGAYAMSNDSRQILLTFDQGYENGYTAEILDTLRDKHVTALFFLTGDYAKREPELVKRMIAEGHMLGNHGMTHAALPTLDDTALTEEIMSLHQYMLDNYGYEMQYFRPPCGEYDERSLAKVQSLGYQTVFWSAAHVDWKTDDQPEPASALQNLTDMAHGGAIYLLHSVSSTNTQILGDLIDNLRAQGYQV